MMTCASRRLRKPLDAQTLVTKLAVNDSFVPFCQGFPGSMMAVSMRASVNHCRMALLTNSGPLSERR
jgi:hypothetical protein